MHIGHIDAISIDAGSRLPPQVADVFEANASALTEEGKTTTISVPQSAEFSISDGKQAKCQFTFSTINLQIPYTATAAFLFDAEGATSWVTSFAASYQAASYTNIETVVTFTAGGKTGGRRLQCRLARSCSLAPSI